jgi:hypothetical protein
MTLLKRYFAAAAASDGAAACALLVPSVSKVVPEDLGRSPGPAYARGATCATVMSKIFAPFHRQLALHVETLRISEARIEHDEAIVVMSFKRLPAREIRVGRDHGLWRVHELLDGDLP